MPAGVVSDTCRLTVVSARSRMDLAVTVDTPVAELLVTLLAGLGPQVADEAAAQGGWVLQRAGDPPLDASATVAAAHLRDGDLLHLRPAASQLPEIAFDDVLDAVATSVNTRTPRWAEAYTVATCVIAAAAALAFFLALLITTGPPWTASTITAGITAALLLGVATVLSRGYSRISAALVAASAAMLFAALAGGTVLADERSLGDFDAAQLLPGIAALVLVAVLGLILLGTGAGLFVAVIGAGLLGLIAAGASTLSTLHNYGSAALVAAVALALSPLLPILAFRLVRLPLPSIPASAEDLRRDTASIRSAAVLSQAARANSFLTGLVSALAAVLGAAGIVLATGGVSERILAGVLAGICLLRARLFTGRGQRIALLLAGAVVVAAIVVARAVTGDATSRILGYGVPAGIGAGALLALAVLLPGRTLAPPWARAADVFETVLVLSVIPLALGVVGVYGAARGLSS